MLDEPAKLPTNSPSLYFPERLVTSTEVSPQRPIRRHHGAAVTAWVLVAVALAAAIFLAAQTWSGGHRSPVATAVLRLNLVSGVVPAITYCLAGALLVAVIVQKPTRRTVVRCAIGVGSGALLGVATVWYLLTSDALGVGLSVTTIVWGVAGLAAIGLGVSALWRTTSWRRLIAALAIVALASATYIGINADFGLDRTVADVAGVSTQKVLSLPTTTPRHTPAPTLLAGGALWANWHAPAGMPATGSQGQVTIPNTVSHFPARPAGLYLPPAALVPNPPALPLVIMMMGQPGNPDPSFSAAVLDRFAAQHNGLAPIVLVADQLGDPAVDSLCLDTAQHGNAETYISQDVVGWARAHLHVLQDPAHWTIAGYSNGGECALGFGVKYPQIWGNVLDISGEEYPGADSPAQTLAATFHGNRAAYDAVKPLNELASHAYTDTDAIFTVGSNDGTYRTQAKAVFAATTAAKWKTTYFEVLNGGHVLGALNGGLQEGYSVLYPRLGLSAP